MIKTVKFPPDSACRYQGRNGWGKQIGVELMTKEMIETGQFSSNPRVMLTPINTRGIATGFLEVPAASIDAVIRALQEARDELCGVKTQVPVEEVKAA